MPLLNVENLRTHFHTRNGVVDWSIFWTGLSLVSAAVLGQGVALARRSLALADIAAGRLVLAFPSLRPLPTGKAYFLAAPRENYARPDVAAFRTWLLEEAQILRS